MLSGVSDLVRCNEDLVRAATSALHLDAQIVSVAPAIEVNPISRDVLNVPASASNTVRTVFIAPSSTTLFDALSDAKPCPRRRPDRALMISTASVTESDEPDARCREPRPHGPAPEA